MDINMQAIWWSTAALMVVIEIALPGAFLLCIGIAAAAVGLILLQMPDLSIENQSLLFVIVGIVSSLVYAWIFGPSRRRPRATGETLNQRSEQLIGHRFVVTQPIVNGAGKIAVGDGQWLVTGDDAPVGSTVKVTVAKGSLVQVELE